MGLFVYGSAPAIDIEDRLLRHLQVVMVQKLRRNESFAFRWNRGPGIEGDQERPRGEHGIVWVSGSSQLYFAFDDPWDKHKLNPAWLDILMAATYKPDGLTALPEPPAPRGASPR